MMELETSFNYPLKKLLVASRYGTKQTHQTSFNLNIIENLDSIIENA